MNDIHIPRPTEIRIGKDGRACLLFKPGENTFEEGSKLLIELAGGHLGLVVVDFVTPHWVQGPFFHLVVEADVPDAN